MRNKFKTYLTTICKEEVKRTKRKKLTDVSYQSSNYSILTIEMSAIFALPYGIATTQRVNSFLFFLVLETFVVQISAKRFFPYSKRFNCNSYKRKRCFECLKKMWKFLIIYLNGFYCRVLEQRCVYSIFPKCCFGDMFFYRMLN